MHKLITTLGEMKNLESDWNALGKRFSSPMLQFDWFFNCAKFLHSESQLRIFAIYSNGELTAVAPLVLVKYRFSRWLEILGTSIIYEPTGLLYKYDDSLSILIKAILSYGLPVNLQRLSECSPEINMSMTTKRPMRLCILRKSASSYYIEPEINWDKFLLQSGKKWSADFRNKANRANRTGKIKVDSIYPNTQTIAKYFHEAIGIESRSWKGEQGTALINNTKLREFFEAYFYTCAAKNSLLIDFYKLNNQAIAMHIAELHDNRFWSYKIGYDVSFSRISPGMQLIMAVIKKAFLGGHSYEFLGSSESWQKAWSVKEHKYFSVILYPFTIRGIIGFIDTLTETLQRKLSRVFSALLKKKI